MKFGDMNRDVDLKKATAEWMFGVYTRKAFLKEGEELLEKHPEYQYLKEDPGINDEKALFVSVLYAYIIDQLLKDHPNFQRQYEFGKWQEIHKAESDKQLNGKENKIYSKINGRFIRWYLDYLRGQANPGVLEREHLEYYQKQQELKIDRKVQEMRERVQLQQDLTSGKRVVCPYCKSTNTEKISTMSRAVSVSLVGAASSKLGKQWHCKHCGSDF